MGIRLMDSSVRDGGNVNNWNFGKRALKGIIGNLQASGVDIIELGYLRNTDFDENRSLYNTIEEAKKNIPDTIRKEEYSLMIQEDKWDWNKLVPCDGVIRHIRVSFHKFDINEGLELCKIVMDNGYICHCNPINIMGYSDKELLELIELINKVHPDVFTIVDTFGSMNIDDMKRIESLIHNNMYGNIKISAHLHENLGLAYSLAIEFISYFENKRDIYVDASVLGIGRVPGNLCLELIMGYLINEKKFDYQIEYIYDAIDDFVSNIKIEHPWGYAVPYALSATYNVHRTYAEFLVDKGKLRTKDICSILSSIEPSKKVIYNPDYIEKLYENYLNVNIDDNHTLDILSNKLKGKNILVLAPGKSLVTAKDGITALIREKRCVVFCVNFTAEFIDSDYYFFTNFKRISYEAGNIDKSKIIMTSNLMHEQISAGYLINCFRLKKFGDELVDDSVLCLLHLLKIVKVNNIDVAGFDGFAENDNHYDQVMDRSFDYKEHTESVKRILQRYFKNCKINFLTNSLYKDSCK